MRILFVLALFATSSLIGQNNLVPDPGFELINTSPDSAEYGPNFPDLPFWFSANGTPDHLSVYETFFIPGAIDTTCLPFTTGGVECGKPYKGDGVGGFYRGNGAAGSKEWARTEFTEPMEEGSCYKVSWMIRNVKDQPYRIFRIDTLYDNNVPPNILRKDTSYIGPFVTNQWGAYFSEGAVIGFSPNLYDFSLVEDHIIQMDSIVDNAEWEYYEEIFHAKKNYDFMFIGYVGTWAEEKSFISNPAGVFGAYTWYDEVSVVKLEGPKFFGGLEDSIVCLNDEIILEMVADTNYTISFEGNVVATDTSYSFIPTEIGTYTFSASSTYSDECTIVNEFTVIVPDLQVTAEYYTADTLPCPLEGVCHGVIEMSASGGLEPYTFVWADDTTKTDSVRTGLCNGEICVLVSDASHCPTDTTWCVELDFRERVYASMEIELPNICTPDGDGKNDVFQPGVWWSNGSRGPIHDFPNVVARIDKYHLVVTNRWGKVLFETFDKEEVWNLMEEDLQSGTYFYAMQYIDTCFSDQLQTREGAVEFLFD